MHSDQKDCGGLKEPNDTQFSSLQVVPQCALLQIQTLVLVTCQNFNMLHTKDQHYTIKLRCAQEKGYQDHWCAEESLWL